MILVIWIEKNQFGLEKLIKMENFNPNFNPDWDEIENFNPDFAIFEFQSKKWLKIEFQSEIEISIRIEI